MTITQILLYTTLSGVIGTGLGGVLGVMFGKKAKSLSRILAFASGIMFSIVCIDIIPSGYGLYLKNQNIFISAILVIIGLLCGIAIIIIVTLLISKKEQIKQSNDIKISGLTIFFAIFLHNLPEGMAIGSGSKDVVLSASLILLIGLHNIPEGMSIAVPLKLGGSSKIKCIIMSAISGISTVIGGIIGWFITGISNNFSALCLLIAGGAMLYITFNTLLAEVYSEDKKNKNNSVIYVLFGILIGIFTIYLLEGLI